MPTFEIVTKTHLYDIDIDDYDAYVALWDEQCDTLCKKGFDLDKSYRLHFFDSAFFDEYETDDYIGESTQFLAIKDGLDLVRFETGNYGFVAYYNNHCNGFEILKESMEED